MNLNRIAKQAAVAAGLILCCAVPGLADAPKASPGAAQNPHTVAHGTQPKRDTLSPDDFAGLDFTDEQNAELEKIHRESEAQKAAVAKDEKLNADQKEALLTGYARMEYGRRFNVLSPEQRREVRQRITARQEAD